MSREVVISALAALGCHALLLFGLRMEKGALPLPVADTEVEVSLVEAAPQAPAPPAAEAAPPPVPEPVSEPTPEPVPKPLPAEPRVAKPAPALRGGTVSGTGAPGVSADPGLANTKPRYRSNPRPDYPTDARQLHQQGRVLLEVEVSASGLPASVALKRSSGVASLDAAALAAVRRWTFEPARTAGLPVAARVEVPVQFDLTR